MPCRAGYEVHLCGGTFNVAGAAYVGMPGVLFGRNERVAWGCTNNICSHVISIRKRRMRLTRSCFLYAGQWEPWKVREEVIQVKGGESVRKTIRSSRNGPIVDEVLPAQAGNVSLRWLGAEHGGWLTALLAMNRAGSVRDFREALRPWHVPTFSVVFADVEGHFGYHSTGRIPHSYGVGAWLPARLGADHQWHGLIPFEGMAQLADPQRGWIATANNRPARRTFPYPLSGTWSEGMRASRIRQMIEGKDRFSPDDFCRHATGRPVSPCRPGASPACWRFLSPTPSPESRRRPAT